MKYLTSILLSIFLLGQLSAQKATIREEKVRMPTYMFSDPDPVARVGRIYPYFRFDGFTNIPADKEWNMVILENEFIQVFVCPEIGGKVWGAIEKSTGKEFLYYNSVVKFRDVAMRGPWTSGGLEFNFGDIGHIPTCATPVDYLVRENMDGGVSCVVGAIDLPSGTRWNIEIILKPGKAFFETNVSWFNDTPLPVTYYHWMNAAAKSSGNLEFAYPGSNQIGHDGEPGEWPISGGRNLSWYENNNFGSYKSYHVINSYSDFFGGYWHDDEFGFGHYAKYDDKPGKKLWIWGLSPQGMIWENLLTDSDGQYIEYQAGKLFNQAANSTQTPFKHREFASYDADIMSEMWFPVLGTEGMVAVSEYAVLNVEEEGDSISVLLSPLQQINDRFTVRMGDTEYIYRLDLEPLQLFKTKVAADIGSLKIELGDKMLTYSSESESSMVHRPVKPDFSFNWESAYGKYTIALELEKQREYNKAHMAYLECIDEDPGFLPAVSRLALSYYRKMDYKRALEFSIRGLSIDTYDPLTNYIYGLVNQMIGMRSDAMSGFSIASQSPAYRSAAYTELAKMYLLESDFKMAIQYAQKAINFNSYNLHANEILEFSYRKNGQVNDARGVLERIYSLDPLSDFGRYEEVLQGTLHVEELRSKITNEFSTESYLDLAANYLSLGDTLSALDILSICPEHPVVYLWISYLDIDNRDIHIDKMLEMPVRFVFPHRVETAFYLEQLLEVYPSWKLKYYLALTWWNRGLVDDAKRLFLECGNDVESYEFFMAKSEIFREDPGEYLSSITKAYKLAPGEWRAAVALADYYLLNSDSEKAIRICEDLLKKYSENSSVGICYSKALIESGEYKKCLFFLQEFELLPYEGSKDGKILYNRVCYKLATEAILVKQYKDAVKYAGLSMDWPSNLGVGKPYDVDNRIGNYLLARASELMGNKSKYTLLSEYQHPDYLPENSKLYLQALAIEKTDSRESSILFIQEALERDKSNPYLQWVKAKFLKSPEATEIEDRLLNNALRKGAIETLYIDDDFDIIIDLLSIIE